MNTDELLTNAKSISFGYKEDNVVKADAQIISFLLDNCEFSIPEEAVFWGRVNCENIMREIINLRISHSGAMNDSQELLDGCASRAYSGGVDFGHTAPLWDDVIALGIPGLKKRANEIAPADAAPDFIFAVNTVYDAAIRFMRRASDISKAAGKTEMAESLMHLSENPPKTMYEAMQLILVFYTFQNFFEATIVRTLGRLDRILMPFCDGIENDKLNDLTAAFITELNAMKVISNMPFMLCGSDLSGRDLTNRMSYTLLRTYTKLKPADVKIHILCADSTPDDFLRIAFKGIKNGANSITFIDDTVMKDSLKKIGQTEEAAADYSIVGCYECCGREETACSCNAIVNIPKALELALHNGIDPITGKQIGVNCSSDYGSFDELYASFLTQLHYLVEKAMEITNHSEERYPQIHSSPFFTSTYPTCLKNGGDVFCHSSTPYPNSSINAIGLATAVDSLAAVEKLVYKDSTITLDEFVAILDSNWENYEVLRGQILRKFPKYGCNIPAVDSIAVNIVDHLSEMINNIPNAKGGIYRLGLFSLDWRYKYGRGTSATPDGRLRGETLSQNTSPSFGADREGSTANILSITKIDSVSVPNGAILDLDLHMSAVLGDKGTDAMMATLRTFLDRGGFAIHYNVLDKATLKDAMEHPERHPNLQVRLCGWNVKFTELSHQAQTEFIMRSECRGG